MWKYPKVLNNFLAAICNAAISQGNLSNRGERMFIVISDGPITEDWCMLTGTGLIMTKMIVINWVR